MKLLIATRSGGKGREIRALFSGLPFELRFPDDQYLSRHPDEDDLERGTTYVENAVAKARYFAERSGLATAADDSGIEVDALKGAPGVYSARWAGVGSGGAEQDRRNNAKLVTALAGVPEEARTARYRCVVAYLATPESEPNIVEATCEGSILLEARGAAGFGYDPYFFSTDLQQSFGEAAPAAKERVSHRGRAFRALIELLVRQGA